MFLEGLKKPCKIQGFLIFKILPMLLNYRILLVGNTVGMAGGVSFICRLRLLQGFAHTCTRHLNCKPFNYQTNPHDLNTELVCYSDPHCKVFFSALKNLRLDEKSCDLHIICKNDNVILAHQIVLALASNFLHKIFSPFFDRVEPIVLVNIKSVVEELHS